MRAALVQANRQDLLCDILRQVGPVGLGTYLKEGPGFRVRYTGQEDQQARQDGPSYRFENTGLAAEAAIEYNAALGVAVQLITLTNTGREPTPPIRDINAFYLRLNLSVGDQPYAYGYGGGLTDGVYPPRAYR